MKKWVLLLKEGQTKETKRRRQKKRNKKERRKRLRDGETKKIEKERMRVGKGERAREGEREKSRDEKEEGRSKGEGMQPLFLTALQTHIVNSYIFENLRQTVHVVAWLTVLVVL